MTKLIVTGATGVIGHALLESCMLRRQEVYVIVNPNSLRKKDLPHGLRSRKRPVPIFITQ